MEEIKRGDIYYINYNTDNSEVGSEQKAGRPAIIVSNDTCNRESGVVEIVYLTTQNKTQLPTHVDINSARYRSIALCEQIKSVDKSKLGDYMGHITEAEEKQLNKALAVSLGLIDIISDDRRISININL